MAQTRDCEQCGTSFVPRREHARFCSPGCRAAWNEEHTGDLRAGTCALRWSITAMSDTARRLSEVAVQDRARAYAAVTEAVWWTAIVDATLVRHHLDAYDEAMAVMTPGGRQLVEQTLAGLRFVRNQIGAEADLAEFTGPAGPAPDAGDGPVTAWMWKSLRAPTLGSLSPQGRSWEMSRYQAYQAWLAGRTIGGTFALSAAFLKRAAAVAPAVTFAAVHPGR